MKILASDTFTRADSSSLGNAEVGGAWTVLTAGWRITGNKAARTSGQGSTAVAALTLATTDVDMSVEIVSQAVNDGIVLRAVDANNYLLINLSSSGLLLWKQNSGVFTTLDTYAGFTLTAGTTYTIRTILLGTSYWIYLDGTLRLSGTLTGTGATITGTKYGFRSTGAANSSTYDNLAIADTIPAPAMSLYTPAMRRAAVY